MIQHVFVFITPKGCQSTKKEKNTGNVCQSDIGLLNELRNHQVSDWHELGLLHMLPERQKKNNEVWKHSKLNSELFWLSEFILMVYLLWTSFYFWFTKLANKGFETYLNEKFTWFSRSWLKWRPLSLWNNKSTLATRFRHFETKRQLLVVWLPTFILRKIFQLIKRIETSFDDYLYRDCNRLYILELEHIHSYVKLGYGTLDMQSPVVWNVPPWAIMI